MSVRVYKFADFTFDTNKHEISDQNGTVTTLNKKRFDVLFYLIESRGAVLTYDQIIKNCWDEEFVENGTLTTVINEIRSILKDNKSQNIIKTYPKVGYRFVADVTVESIAEPPEPLSESQSEPKLIVADVAEKSISEPLPATFIVDVVENSIPELPPESRQEKILVPVAATKEPMPEPQLEPKPTNFKEEANKKKQSVFNKFINKLVSNIYKSNLWFIVLCFCILVWVLILSFVSNLLVINFVKVDLKPNDLLTMSGGISHLLLIVFTIVCHLIFYNKVLRKIFVDTNKNDEITDQLLEYTGHTDKEEGLRALTTAQGSLNQFMVSWGLLLFAWFVLYIVISAGVNSKFFQIVNLCKNFANNFNTLFAFFCFYNLYKPVKIKKDNQGVAYWHFFLLIILGIILIFSWTGTEIWLLDKYNQWHPREFSSIEEYNKLFKENFNILKTTTTINGVLGGLALSLYIARLQSRFLGRLSILASIVLFSYVTIQSFYIFFDNPDYTAILIPLVLFQKCVLIFFIFLQFHSGRLFYYFVRLRVDYEEEWNNFKRVLSGD